MVVVIMGVSGSGKTTIGSLLATRLRWSFFDADDFHPVANVEKMKQGIPLTDEDRAPWLERLNRDVIRASIQRGTDAVLACSALKDRYRQVLMSGACEQVLFVHLTGSADLIQKRMEARQHFMSPAMLASQLAALETPGDALELDIGASPETLVGQIVAHLRR